MPYNIKLEEKIDAATENGKNMQKKKMFGGICYLFKGNMSFGIWKDFLIVRMDREKSAKSLESRNVKAFDITGRPMAGWIMVSEEGWRSSVALSKWLAVGKKFALSLAEKKGKTGKRKTKTLKEYKT